MSNNIVAVMAKSPEISKVKTRLAKTMGNQKALDIYKILLENLIKNCSPSNQDSYQLGCFITPPETISNFQKIYDSFDFYLPQSGNDLGEKMFNALHGIFSEFKADKVILLGVDIPDLNRNLIEEAFKKLDTNDIVLGPTDDGGYYLIGMKKSQPELFNNIEWGTPSVYEESIKICQSLSYSYSALKPLSDLDVESDLIKFPNILKKLQ